MLLNYLVFDEFFTFGGGLRAFRACCFPRLIESQSVAAKFVIQQRRPKQGTIEEEEPAAAADDVFKNQLQQQQE